MFTVYQQLCSLTRSKKEFSSHLRTEIPHHLTVVHESKYFIAGGKGCGSSYALSKQSMFGNMLSHQGLRCCRSVLRDFQCHSS